MKSWKTTLGGVIALIGTTIAATWPEYSKIGMFLSSFGAGLGLLFARDNKVTSEQAGAKPPVTIAQTIDPQTK